MSDIDEPSIEREEDADALYEKVVKAALGPGQSYRERRERDLAALRKEFEGRTRESIEAEMAKLQPTAELTPESSARYHRLRQALEDRVDQSRAVVPQEVPAPEGVDIGLERDMADGAFDTPIDSIPAEVDVYEALARETRAAEAEAEFARHEGRVSTGFPDLPGFPRDEEEDDEMAALKAEGAMRERLTARIERLERKLAAYRALVHELTGED